MTEMKWLNCLKQHVTENGKIANYSLSLVYSRIHSLTDLDGKVNQKIN